MTNMYLLVIFIYFCFAHKRNFVVLVKQYMALDDKISCRNRRQSIVGHASMRSLLAMLTQNWLSTCCYFA